LWRRRRSLQAPAAPGLGLAPALACGSGSASAVRRFLAAIEAGKRRTQGSEVSAEGQELDLDLIEAIARRVAEVLGEERSPVGTEVDLIDAAAVARRLGISRATVYAKAEQLGAIRLGEGKRARLRFDPTRLPVQLASGPSARSRPRRRRSARPRQKTPLLPINPA
jgi:hypothetical protein